MSRFLILDDEPLITTMLAEWLEQQGHDVAGLAHTATEALDLVERTHIEAAILDIQLRDGSAYAVASELRQRHIPFLFATGWSTDSIDADFQHEPIVRKPFEFEALGKSVLDLVTPSRVARPF